MQSLSPPEYPLHFCYWKIFLFLCIFVLNIDLTVFSQLLTHSHLQDIQLSLVLLLFLSKEIVNGTVEPLGR